MRSSKISERDLRFTTDCKSDHAHVKLNIAETPFLAAYSQIRVPNPTIDQLLWDSKQIQFHQMYRLYALQKFCRNHEGNSLDPQLLRAIAAEQIFKVDKGSSRIFRSLANPDHFLTQKWDAIFQEKKLVRHFGGKALEMHKAYTDAHGLPEPRNAML